jgi:hypothetical protein
MISEETVCYITKQHFSESILGFGLNVTWNEGRYKIEKITSPLEFLSESAWNSGCRKSSLNEKITHWLPIYISEDHWKRALPLIKVILPLAFFHKTI